MTQSRYRTTIPTLIKSAANPSHALRGLISHWHSRNTYSSNIHPLLVNTTMTAGGEKRTRNSDETLPFTLMLASHLTACVSLADDAAARL